MRKTQRPKDGGHKVIPLPKHLAQKLTKGLGGSDKWPSMVSQLRLAHVQQLQSTILYYKAELRREWNRLRKELMSGKRVENGPLRAIFMDTKRGNGKRLVVK
jgi:hypothetical protein